MVLESFLNDLFKIHQANTRKIPLNKSDKNIGKVKNDITSSVTQQPCRTYQKASQN